MFILEVVDVVNNDGDIVILDIFVIVYMFDVLEMLYWFIVLYGSFFGEKVYDVKLGGNLCLVGDVIDSYFFDVLLKSG